LKAPKSKNKNADKQIKDVNYDEFN
jgi:hypothetical protein